MSLSLSVSLGLWQDRPAEEALLTARAADDLGYPELWVGEMATYDAFALATAIGLATTRIRLTVGPLAVAVRDPMMIAMGAASVAGLTASPQQGIYCVSKAGLIMLTRVLARELGPHNIRVNCICPGVIKTRLSEALWKDPHAEQQSAHLKALGRVGQTEELIGAALYFASDASSFTTGASLQVDGGMVI